ncbi:MAG: nitrous oxide reductase accessory protein NosL [Flavobacteriales bacterium]|jgi:copper chaperone NosL|uniref:nitrous oxide reductase accessory protein NosL n=1 Tax=Candidatus Ulvibacter alkanivorans TaxID=2267620 RepID=UPI000DF1EE9B|nr:nitrous oxide reductase accessory protein NosL [Candidatus Ulvibacter alkanivorans]MCH2489360.1 nitrous oxide reductase accessory protein NosL [Flavobacteriales bacterium]
MRPLKLGLLILLTLLLQSCSTDPKTIEYGNDGCHYCKMTIVDKIHGAEIVTQKGKIYTFDATECLLNYLQDNSRLEQLNCYTNYYESPTELIPSTEATYLISKGLPSPMGANLTAFKNKAEAEQLQLKKGGEIYNWEQLQLELKKR